MPRDRPDTTRAQRPFRIDRGRSAHDEARRFERLLAEPAGAFVRATVDQIDAEINRWLERIGLTLGLDRRTVAQVDPAIGPPITAMDGHVKDSANTHAPQLNVVLPWLKPKILAGETVVFSCLDELPQEAVKDIEISRRFGPKSNVTIPVKVGDVIIGAVGLGVLERERKWPQRSSISVI